MENLLRKNKWMTHSLIGIIILLFVGCPNALAQSFQVTGIVKDQKGEPLVGVSVLEKGTTNGVVTDLDGKFAIRVTSGSSMLVITYMGYMKKELSVQRGKILDVSLQEDVSELDEVMVIAYGTKKKRDVIGSVTKVKSDDLVLSTGGRFENALQGKAAGVQIVNDGIAGNTPQIKIRGIRSVSSGTDPLWVVDGMVGGDASNLNFYDIESIEILKDAAATAIYGSRGSNGVIIVTTKRGKQGTPQFSISYEYGVTSLTKKNLGIASTEEYFEVMDLARQHTGKEAFDPQRDVIKPFWNNCESEITREEAMLQHHDYVGMTTRTGFYHDLNVSVTQGSESVSNYASFNYRKDETNLKGRGLESYSARLNTDYKKGLLSLGVQAFGRFRVMDNVSYWDYSPLVPWYKIYDENSPSGYWNPRMGNGATGMNPMALIDGRYRDNESRNLNLRLNAYIELAIPKVKGLAVRADASLGYGNSQNNSWTSNMITRNNNLDGDSGSRNKNTSYSQQYHLFGKYKATFGLHGIDAVVGIESSRGYTDYLTLSGKKLTGNFQELSGIGTYNSNSTGYISGENYGMSFFSRLDYKFMERYLVGASFIREGSSKFVKENRWANFFSASAGWIISDEAFMKSFDWISMLKLRGSYGETGNQNIPSEATITSYAMKPKQFYDGTPNMYMWSVPNKGAKWEKTKSIDVGIDYAFFNNRLNGSIAYYRQNVDDMLLKVQLPASAGIPDKNFSINFNNSMWANIGSMYNEGFEFDINYNVINAKDFSWSTGFNLTYNRNEVTALSPDVDTKGTGIINTRPGVITKKGLPIGTYFLAEWAGVDPEKGIGLIYEIDQDVYSKTGRTVKTGNVIPATGNNINKNRIIQDGKSGMPKVYGGWTNNFTYRNFDLSFMFYFSTGNYIYNRWMDINSKAGDGRNNVIAGLVGDSWQQPGDNSKYPEIRWGNQYNIKDDGTPGTGNYGSNDVGTTQFLEKASFLRLKNLTFGYTLPENLCRKIAISKLRLYVTATNLFTITDFSGWDPEVRLSNNKNGANSQGILFQGNEMPQIRNFSIGASLNF
ncbi:SusC/RagA family TonB-linked outer membrane protein [Bacteroides finegoldii]|uniref:SusC/RagA family TonB-linked outer membrane protein n=1 Tax=Bacteroides finegoldii TaxID=338188 RepID=UPI001E3716EF|nr:TonB-dependent receptor [Bacteroides finegoldii]